MKILHGENQVQSREKLTNLKKEAKAADLEIVSLPGKSVMAEELIQAVESSSLFGSDRIVMIEGLLSSPKSKRLETVIDYLVNKKPDNVTLWEGKKVDGRRFKKLLTVAQSEEFKLSPSIFKFVESLKPGNTKEMLSYLDECLKVDAPELILYMMVRQTRMMIEIISDPGEFRGPPWLKGKILSQAKSFGLEGLLRLHEKLFEVDKKIKTGSSGLGVATELELLLMSL